MKKSARKQGTLTIFFHIVLVLHIWTTIGISFCVSICFSTYLKLNWIFIVKDEMLEKQSVNMHSSYTKNSQILYEQQFSPQVLAMHARFHSMLVTVLYASSIKILIIMKICMYLLSFLKYMTTFITHLRGR